MAAAHCAHPSGRTSGTPGPPPSRSQPPSLGLHLPASGLATRNPAPPEPLLLLVTVGCPSERRVPAAPHPGAPGGGSVVPLAGKETAGVGQRALCRPRRA
ncbi:hypothetical protein D623_10033466 [Myotis brandtii]|uniref:Uncharacterized protein n=1 Tax=Myotis brandtii TaxID=109478 RepID=S7P9R5_MYOBR|nr:hypothetical protein D623_10033466 [Myotis brandtii]